MKYIDIVKKVSGIYMDSRNVKKNGLFVAIKGKTVDSHNFISDVIKKGATVIVGEKDIDVPADITYIKVKNSRQALGEIASEFYQNPSEKMKVVGVTGTDGKTTTSYFLYQILRDSGIKVGLVSTVGAYIGNKKFDTGLHVTNPVSIELHRILAKMVEKKCEVAIIETTSHGIDQDRIAGIKYDIAVLTNITKEHLDYHKTYKNLVKTKSKLFERSKVAILNKDHKSSKLVKKNLSNQEVVYYSIRKKLITNIKQKYNLYNLSAAMTTAEYLGASNNKIKKAISDIELPIGRFEQITNDKDVSIIIDFAHTPNAVKSVLSELKKNTKNKLIAVLGSAGERDFKKRRDMGKAASVADFVILTAEDPRSEDAEQIISQMSTGVTKDYVSIPERGEAIYKAINTYADPGDVVIILGKGHEQSMNYKGIEYEWSDHKAVDYALGDKILYIKRNKYKDKKIAILGLGKEGSEVLEFLKNKEANITVFDKREDIKKDKDVQYNLGEDYLSDGLEGYDFIFRSPGFYRYMKEIKLAEKKGAIITSEVKLFFEEFKGTIIGITGTNGKGTTATLLYDVMKLARKSVFLSGNIGTSNLLSILDISNEKSFAILELSSFQLIDLLTSPHIAVVTNISQDHLDWHRDMDEYINAKKQLVIHQNKHDYAVLNKEDKISKRFSKDTPASIKYFDSKPKKFIKTNLAGVHNIQNINASIEVAKILGIGNDKITKAVKKYKPLPHRLEFVREINNKKFYNDSCATSPKPTLAAIDSFNEPITLILGGYDKKISYDSLVQGIISSPVENVILTGQTSAKIKKLLEQNKVNQNIYMMKNDSMKEIVKKANAIANEGVVLLSPACASFGSFENYKDRGDQFCDAVKQLPIRS